MYRHGLNASAGLPREGEAVEFVLDGRGVAIVGAYAQQVFRSRWAGYGIERVSSWRSSDADSSAGASEHHENSCNARRRERDPR